MIRPVGCPEELHFCLPSPPLALCSLSFTKISLFTWPSKKKDSAFLTFLNMRMTFFLDFRFCWNLIF